MKTKFFLLAAAAAFTVTFTACDDDDDDNLVTPAQVESKTEMIAGKDWIITSIIETSDNQSINVLANQPLTAQDDVFMFTANGEALRDEGKTKVEGDPQIVEMAPWEFVNGETGLKVDFVSLPTNDEIVEISSKKIVLRNVGPESTTLTTFEVAQ